MYLLSRQEDNFKFVSLVRSDNHFNIQNKSLSQKRYISKKRYPVNPHKFLFHQYPSDVKL